MAYSIMWNNTEIRCYDNGYPMYWGGGTVTYANNVPSYVYTSEGALVNFHRDSTGKCYAVNEYRIERDSAGNISKIGGIAITGGPLVLD